jgi:hypothetical protein
MYALDYGIAASFSEASIDGVCFWLARTKNCKVKVVMAEGNNARPIGNRDIDNLFQGFSTVSDAYGFCMNIAGQNFYIISFPTANQTWAYAVQTNQWTQLQLANGNYWSVANCYMFLNSKHTIGDSATGTLYTLSMSSYRENGGSIIPRTIVTPTLFNGNNWISVPLMRSYVDSSGYSSGTTVSTSISRDGGRTYATTYTDSVPNTRSYVQTTRISAARRINIKITYQANAVFVVTNIMAYVKTRGR